MSNNILYTYYTKSGDFTSMLNHTSNVYYSDSTPFVELDVDLMDKFYAKYEVIRPDIEPMYEVKFNMNFVKIDHKLLSCGCKALIDALAETFDLSEIDILDETPKSNKPNIEGYRLSFNFETKSLQLRIPALFWFDFYLPIDKRLKVANEWVESMERKYMGKNMGIFSKQQILIHKPEYCPNGVNCVKWKRSVANGKRETYGCDKIHSWYTCLKVIQDIASKDVNCNFYIPEEMIVPINFDSRFIVLIRQDEFFTRDLIFVPKPAPLRLEYNRKIVNSNNKTKYEPINEKFAIYNDNYQYKWPGHYSNDKFVLFPEVWQYAQRTCMTLFGMDPVIVQNSLEEIGFNFGNWETKISKDKFAVECHAHGHLIFSKTGYKSLVQNENYKTYISGRVNDPFNYNLDESEKLKIQRTVHLNQKNIANDVAELKTDVAELKTDVAELKTDVAELKTKFDNLDNKFDILNTDVLSMKEMLQQLLQIKKDSQKND
jgi:hypothetical protein